MPFKDCSTCLLSMVDLENCITWGFVTLRGGVKPVAEKQYNTTGGFIACFDFHHFFWGRSPILTYF